MSPRTLTRPSSRPRQLSTPHGASASGGSNAERSLGVTRTLKVVAHQLEPVGAVGRVARVRRAGDHDVNGRYVAAVAVGRLDSPHNNGRDRQWAGAAFGCVSALRTSSGGRSPKRVRARPRQGWRNWCDGRRRLPSDLALPLMWASRIHHARMLLLREGAERRRSVDLLLPSAHPGWVAAAHAVHAEVGERLAQQHQVSVATWQRRVDAWLASQFEAVEIRVRMRSPGFGGFVHDGRYVTQFERPGVSGGAKHHALRTLVEHTVLGVPPDCAPRDRPVYGYLSNSDESSPALQQYGPVILHLKPSVMRRATFTGADSFDFAVHAALGDPCLIPAPVGRPASTALPAYDIFVATHATPPTFGRLDVDPLGHTGFGDLTSYGYAEAQIFGGLSLADVRAVTITLNAAVEPQLLAELDEIGVGWIMTPGDQP
jgi:hypothetical protein